MRKKDKDATDAQDFTGMPAASAPVTPGDIQSKEFSVSRFGGYRMRDVDEFLDQITESMTKLVDENQRLRSAGGLPATPSIGAPDLADTSRQADEIIESARAEAAKIVQDARAQVAVGATAVVAGTEGGRAAVAPFLAQERDFLQQLAALVQSHAESVKGMAKANRAKPAAATAPATATQAPPPPAAAPAQPSPPAPQASDSTQPMPPVKPAAAPAPAERAERTAAPIRVEEPATASVSAGDGDDDGGQGEGGDRSLRELFWGEE
jgi:DivIVA domain-containing protein